jgi:biopolymer transport protein ExbB
MLDFLIRLSVMSKGLIPFMAVIFLASLAAIAERLYFFARTLRAGESIEHDIKLMRHGNREDLEKIREHYADTIQVPLVQAALAARDEDAESMDRHIEEAAMWQYPLLDRNLWVVDTAVTLGPLLGLLGTIIGMIESFGILDKVGSGNPAAVTGGIANALIATALGLLIAIVSLIFLNYFRKRLQLSLHQLDLIKTMLINRLQGAA